MARVIKKVACTEARTSKAHKAHTSSAAESDSRSVTKSDFIKRVLFFKAG
jgi:hypothetical protein